MLLPTNAKPVRSTYRQYPGRRLAEEFSSMALILGLFPLGWMHFSAEEHPAAPLNEIDRFSGVASPRPCRTIPRPKSPGADYPLDSIIFLSEAHELDCDGCMNSV